MIRSPELRDAYDMVKADKKAQRTARKEAARQHIRAIVASNAPGRRNPRQRDNGYLAFLRRLPCAIDGAKPSDAAHLRFTNLSAGRTNPGLAKKPHDRFAVPLCRVCHTDQHANNEARWWAGHGIDPDALASALYAAFLAGQDGEPVVRRFARVGE